jgi:hypothetical protein
VYGDQRAGILSLNENRILQVGDINVFTEELSIFQNILYQELGLLVPKPTWFPHPHEGLPRYTN